MAGATLVPSRACLHSTRPTRLENMVHLLAALTGRFIPFEHHDIIASNQNDQIRGATRAQEEAG